jgi:nitrite reductase (NADH) large subunit
MVGHHFVERILEVAPQAFQVTVLCEERHLAYDRVNLSKYFDGKTAADLSLANADVYAATGVEVLVGDPALRVDPATQTLQARSGKTVAYDSLIFATGSYPFVPPVEGKDAKGCFVYRTLDDLDAIRAYAERSNTGVVIGGGLLGLEAANALRNLGLETHVVEMGPRLMPLQIDDVGGALLKRSIEGLGVAVHTGMSTKHIIVQDACVAGLKFSDDGVLAADIIVFSAGVRPRDQLARDCGLEIGGRGGIVVDAHCRASLPNIFAIGECASWNSRTYGLVAPGYRMADVAVEALTVQGESRLGTFDLSTKLKLMGVDVASFGDAFASDGAAHTLSILDSVAGIYKKLVVSADRERLLGGTLVGDASSYSVLLAMVQAKTRLPDHPENLILPERAGSTAGIGPEMLPDAALLCNCHNVSKGTICKAIADDGLTDLSALKKKTKAGTGCGSCSTLVGQVLKAELKRAGVAVNNHVCEHFPYSRQELFHLVKLGGHRTFAAAIADHGRGMGCEICKPAVASILASIWNEHVLSKPNVGLQDTNDRFLANMQRDGSYSVVPRVPAGEITPRQLVVLGEVAERYGLYTKITGAQRIDLFGARLDQLPGIWRDLIAAGFETGHAYGKALRTVKSCVGSTWCRFGVQDSVSFAIQIENRYKGLRSPHKLKSGVSGCSRECAEAQGKDFGLIATSNGYNLYVCGNGGMTPAHGQLLASDLDTQTVLRYLDRFLMFYIRTADRLERTAPWFAKLEGGIEYLRRVIIDDTLGICAELERDMQKIVDTYQCEWKTTVNDPEKLKMFRPFVNSDQHDPTMVRVPLRSQHRTATWEEKSALVKEAI